MGALWSALEIVRDILSQSEKDESGERENTSVEEGRETGAIVRNGVEIDYINMYLMEREYRENEKARNNTLI